MLRRPLARSLDPIPGEGLDGYLLRLSHRLDISPSRVAFLTGLINGGSANIPISYLVRLPAEIAAIFGAATGLSPSETAALGLEPLAASHPPVSFMPLLGYTAPNARYGAGLKNWVFLDSARYCPECLAGDGTQIQQLHGGAWQIRRRLPIVFACLRHRRMLHHICPDCRQPVLAQGRTARTLIPMPNTILHPAQCRNLDQHRQPRTARTCGARLDQFSHSAGTDPPMLSELLKLQRSLIPRLHNGRREPGQDNPRYFLDLICLFALIKLSWPAASGWDLTPAATATVDHDVEHGRRQAADARRRNAARPQGIWRALTAPTTDPLQNGYLLLQATKLLELHDTSLFNDKIGSMVVALRGTKAVWHPLQTLSAGSKRLDRLFKPVERKGFRLSLSPSRARDLLSNPDDRLRLNAVHIPQFALAEWMQQHGRALQGIHPKYFRRAICIRLVELTSGGTWNQAGAFLGLPHGLARVSVRAVRDWASEHDHLLAFNAAVDAVAKQLETDPHAINYAHRRQVLRDWTFSDEQWAGLLPDISIRGARKDRPGWSERKRPLASIFVWARITQGEPLYSPIAMAAKAATPPRQQCELAVDLAGLQYRDRARSRHGIPLQLINFRRLLDDHADRLAIQIDRSAESDVGKPLQLFGAMTLNVSNGDS